jgi:hypothetical protein
MPVERDRPVPTPVSERRIYRAGGSGEDDRPSRRPEPVRGRKDGPPRAADRRRRSPILALLVLVVIAVIIVLAGIAARGGGLDGSQNGTGTFKLLPITTTTTS